MKVTPVLKGTHTVNKPDLAASCFDLSDKYFCVINVHALSFPSALVRYILPSQVNIQILLTGLHIFLIVLVERMFLGITLPPHPHRSFGVH